MPKAAPTSHAPATTRPKRPPRPKRGSEEHERVIRTRLNALRASVLGANDGIVAIAALLVGVAGANGGSSQIVTAGFAGLAAGALSMATGEYVSVHSQRDAEDAQLARERKWHEERPEWELEQLVRLNMESGMTEEVARIASAQQTAYDPLHIHARMHLNIDLGLLTNPIQAAVASLVAFTIGGSIPFLTIVLAPTSIQIPLTFAVAITCLAGTGLAAARMGHSHYAPAVIRNVLGGCLALAVTYGIGAIVGTQI